MSNIHSSGRKTTSQATQTLFLDSTSSGAGHGFLSPFKPSLRSLGHICLPVICLKKDWQLQMCLLKHLSRTWESFLGKKASVSRTLRGPSSNFDNYSANRARRPLLSLITYLKISALSTSMSHVSPFPLLSPHLSPHNLWPLPSFLASTDIPST